MDENGVAKNGFLTLPDMLFKNSKNLVEKADEMKQHARLRSEILKKAEVESSSVAGLSVVCTNVPHAPNHDQDSLQKLRFKIQDEIHKSESELKNRPCAKPTQEEFDALQDLVAESHGRVKALLVEVQIQFQSELNHHPE